MITNDPLEPSRRKFIARTGAAFASLATVKAAFADTVKQLASWKIYDGYWGKIRDKFLLEEGLGYLNNGTVGPTPVPVYENLVTYWRLMAENPNENSATVQGRGEAIREKAAHFLGASPDELAIFRNC